MSNLSSTHREALLIAGMLLLVSAITVVQTLPPAPLSADAPATEFSAQRAVEHIRVIAKQPRPTGSSANAAARNYILAVMADLGLETETQQAGDLVNVMGRIRGTRSSEMVLLTAHLDSVAEGPGATDDGSGVAVLLETARALVSEGSLPNTVMFLFTDFEEGGLVGAKAFIADHPWAQEARIVIGFDAGGLSGPAVLATTSANNGWLIRQLVQADRYLSGSSAINALGSSGTDFGYAFRPAGYSGYAFDLYWDRRIHTPNDNLGHLSLASLQQQGYHALSLARHFGNLDRLTDPREPEAVYFNVLRLFTVIYPSTWAIPLALAVFGIFCIVLVFGLRQHILTWSGMGYGMFVFVIGIIIAPLPSIVLGYWGHGVPIRYLGRLLDRPPQVAIVVLIALILIGFWYALAHKFRRMSFPNLTMGALGLVLIGMLGTAIVLPALSFAFTWPLLLSLLAGWHWFYYYARRRNSKTVALGLLFSGSASIVILGPTILLGLFDQMPLTLLLLGILCGFLTPLIYLMFGHTTENQALVQETNAAKPGPRY